MSTVLSTTKSIVRSHFKPRLFSQHEQLNALVETSDDIRRLWFLPHDKMKLSFGVVRVFKFNGLVFLLIHVTSFVSDSHPISRLHLTNRALQLVASVRLFQRSPLGNTHSVLHWLRRWMRKQIAKDLALLRLLLDAAGEQRFFFRDDWSVGAMLQECWPSKTFRIRKRGVKLV